MDYFDYSLMHAQNADEFERFKQRCAYETAFELKKEGKIRHVGISFHDCADILEKILTEYPQIEVVQIIIWITRIRRYRAANAARFAANSTSPF